MGRVTPASDPRFTLLPAQYGNRAGHYGRIEAVDALVAMIEAARADGVRLTVVSAFRSFSHQAQIWNGKWRGDTAVGGGRLPETVPEPVERARRILEFSSMPGSSRHHWGTDFDLNSIDPAHFVAGEGKAAHDWLAANAGRFGFCQVYSAKGPGRPTGYEEEKWHWSYMPLADPLLAAWLEQVDDAELAGFEGAEAAAAIGVAANYVAAIDPACAALAAPGG
jgi:LAS superfamily LD-carboxypeptidase LdcB